MPNLSDDTKITTVMIAEADFIADMLNRRFSQKRFYTVACQDENRVGMATVFCHGGLMPNTNLQIKSFAQGITWTLRDIKSEQTRTWR